MKLSKLQISIINNISSGVIYDLDIFLKVFFEYDDERCVGGYIGDYYEFKNEHNVLVIKNKDELINKTAEFISLVEFLKSNNLVHVIRKNVSQTNVFPLFYKKTPNSSPEPFHKFFQMAKNYYDKEILPLPGIHSFMERNYKTTEEYNAELEKKDRQDSQKLTRKIAYITISLSIIVSLVTFSLNYLTYRTERNVKITNTKDFKDTVFVKTLDNTDNPPTDSIKVIK